jgi:hypothetical protein
MCFFGVTTIVELLNCNCLTGEQVSCRYGPRGHDPLETYNPLDRIEDHKSSKKKRIRRTRVFQPPPRSRLFSIVR